MDEISNISVVIGGDFCPVGRPQAGLINGSITVDAIVDSVRALFTESDIGIVNLECPLSEQGTPIAKSGPHVRAHSSMIRLLTHLGITMVTLANNHIRDLGDIGVTDTLKICAANNIRTVGAGTTLEEARQPLYVLAKGRRVAFVNAAEKEFGSATPERAGANPLNIIDLLRDLQLARLQADHVMVIIHGGLELTHCPSPESVKLLRFIAEQNVTAVIRHHSHFVQGYESWKGVPIFYGLGNMLFDLETRMDAGWYQGLLVKLNISSKNKCTVELQPISQCNVSPSLKLLESEAREKALLSIDEYSALLADENALSKAWAETLKPLREDYFSKLIIPSYTLWRIIRRLGLMRFIHPGAWSARHWENFLQCTTHREALIDLLSHESRN
jgi:hypothetical protein